jgi:hypothetical protein
MAMNGTARSVRCVLLSEGLGNLRDRNFYTKAAIVSAVPIFEGRVCFLDHPSATEDRDRPERSVRDLVGYFGDVREGVVTDPDGTQRAALFGTLYFDHSDAGDLAFRKVTAALEYARRFPQSDRHYVGLSINASGVSRPGDIPGLGSVNLIERIGDAFSADIVTRPARGGRFVAVAGR